MATLGDQLRIALDLAAKEEELTPAPAKPRSSTALGRGVANLADYIAFGVNDKSVVPIQGLARTQAERPQELKDYEERIATEARKWSEAEGIGEKAGVVAKTAGAALSEPSQLGSFVAEQAPNAIPSIAAGAAGKALGRAAGRWAGAKLGGTVGAAFGPAGAAIGALAGMAGGGFLTDYLAEKASGVLKEVQDPTDPREVWNVISNKQLMDEKESEALRHATGVSGVDLLTALVTRGVVGRGGIANALKGLGIETAGEMGGEAAGQYNAYGAVDPAEVALEGIGGFAQSAGTTALFYEAKDPNLKEAQKTATDWSKIDPTRNLQDIKPDYTKIRNPLRSNREQQDAVYENQDIAKAVYNLDKANQPVSKQLVEGPDGKLIEKPVYDPRTTKVAEEYVEKLTADYILSTKADPAARQEAIDALQDKGYGDRATQAEELFKQRMAEEEAKKQAQEQAKLEKEKKKAEAKQQAEELKAKNEERKAQGKKPLKPKKAKKEAEPAPVVEEPVKTEEEVKQEVIETVFKKEEPVRTTTAAERKAGLKKAREEGQQIPIQEDTTVPIRTPEDIKRAAEKVQGTTKEVAGEVVQEPTITPKIDPESVYDSEDPVAIQDMLVNAGISPSNAPVLSGMRWMDLPQQVKDTLTQTYGTQAQREENLTQLDQQVQQQFDKDNPLPANAYGGTHGKGYKSRPTGTAITSLNKKYGGADKYTFREFEGKWYVIPREGVVALDEKKKGPSAPKTAYADKIQVGQPFTPAGAGGTPLFAGRRENIRGTFNLTGQVMKTQEGNWVMENIKEDGASEWISPNAFGETQEFIKKRLEPDRKTHKQLAKAEEIQKNIATIQEKKPHLANLSDENLNDILTEAKNISEIQNGEVRAKVIKKVTERLSTKLGGPVSMADIINIAAANREGFLAAQPTRGITTQPVAEATPAPVQEATLVVEPSEAPVTRPYQEIYDQMFDRTLFHTPRNQEDIPGILKDGLRVNTNVSEKDGSQGLSGPIVLVYDKADIAIHRKGNPNEYVVVRQNKVEPFMVAINISDLGLKKGKLSWQKFDEAADLIAKADGYSIESVTEDIGYYSDDLIKPGRNNIEALKAIRAKYPKGWIRFVETAKDYGNDRFADVDVADETVQQKVAKLLKDFPKNLTNGVVLFTEDENGMITIQGTYDKNPAPTVEPTPQTPQRPVEETYPEPTPEEKAAQDEIAKGFTSLRDALLKSGLVKAPQSPVEAVTEPTPTPTTPTPVETPTEAPVASPETIVANQEANKEKTLQNIATNEKRFNAAGNWEYIVDPDDQETRLYDPELGIFDPSIDDYLPFDEAPLQLKIDMLKKHTALGSQPVQQFQKTESVAIDETTDEDVELREMPIGGEPVLDEDMANHWNALPAREAWRPSNERKPVDIPAITNLANAIFDKIRQNVKDLDLVVYRTAEDLAKYPGLRDKLFNADGTGTSANEAQGYFIKKTSPSSKGRNIVVLNANKFISAKFTEMTILHEVVGHYGLRKLLGNRWESFVDKIIDTNPKAVLAASKLIPRWSKLYLTEGDMYHGVPAYSTKAKEGYVAVKLEDNTTTYINKNFMAQMIDEYLAEEAAKFVNKEYQDKQVKNFLQRAIAYVRHILRSIIGGKEAQSVTDEDIAGLLSESYIRTMGDPAQAMTTYEADMETQRFRQTKFAQNDFYAQSLERVREFTTTLLNKLPKEGRLQENQVRRFINAGGIKQADKDIAEIVLKNFKADKKTSFTPDEFMQAMEEMILPISINMQHVNQYNSYGLGNIGRRYQNMDEMFDQFDPTSVVDPNNITPETHVWTSPIETSPDVNHFRDPNYIGHTRTFREGNTYYVSEVQSDIVQKGKFSEVSQQEKDLAEKNFFKLDNVISKIAETVNNEALNHYIRANNIDWNKADGETRNRIVRKTLEISRRVALEKIKEQNILASLPEYFVEKHKILLDAISDPAAFKQWSDTLTLMAMEDGVDPAPNYDLFVKLTEIINDEQDRLSGIMNTTKADPRFPQFKKTINSRLAREEIKKAAQEGMTSIRFPTGNTAAKIEMWPILLKRGQSGYSEKLKGTRQNAGSTATGNWKVKENGMPLLEVIKRNGSTDYIQVDVVLLESLINNLEYAIKPEYQKLYDIYNKELRNILTSDYNAQEVTDEKGHTWLEVSNLEQYADEPILVFSAPLDPPSPMSVDLLHDQWKAPQSQLAWLNQWREGVDHTFKKISRMKGMGWVLPHKIAGESYFKDLMYKTQGTIRRIEMTTRPAAKWLGKLAKEDPTTMGKITTTWLEGGDFNTIPGLSKMQVNSLEKTRNELEIAQQGLNALGYLDDFKYEASKGKYLHTVFISMANEFQGAGKTPSLMKYLEKRKTDPEAKAFLGINRNPEFAIPNTVGMVARDVALLQLMDGIKSVSEARNLGWVLDGGGQKINVRDVPGLNKKSVTYPNLLRYLDQTNELLKSANIKSRGATAEDIATLEAARKALEQKVMEARSGFHASIKEQMIKSGHPYAELDAAGNVVRVLQEPTDSEVDFFLKQNYIRVDGRKNPNLKPFHNKYVHKDIYNEFVNMQDMVEGEVGGAPVKQLWKDMTQQGGLLEKLTTIWKATKTGLNFPIYYMRNAFGNWWLLDTTTDTPSHKLMGMLIDEAKQTISGEGKKVGGKTYKEWAEEYGLYATTYGSAELYVLRENFLDKIRIAEAKEEKKWIKYVGLQFKDTFLILSEMTANFNGLLEGIFKQTSMRDYVERWEKRTGRNFNQLTAQEQSAVMSGAARHANDSIFDYQNVPAWLKQLRRIPLGTPFLTFNYYVAAHLPKAMLKHPWKMAKYYALPMMMMSAALELGFDDEEEEEYLKALESLPWYYRNNASHIVTPFKDKNGKYQVYDFTYMFPPAMFTNAYLKLANPSMGETTAGAVHDVLTKDLGLLGGPVPQAISAILSNKNPFNDRDISVPGDLTEKNIERWLTFFYTLAMPPVITETGFLGRTLDQAGIDLPMISTGQQLNKYGSDKETMAQTALRLTGVSPIGFSPQESQRANLAKYQYHLQNIQKARANALKDRNKSLEDRQQVAKEYAQKIRELNAEYRALRGE